MSVQGYIIPTIDDARPQEGANHHSVEYKRSTSSRSNTTLRRSSGKINMTFRTQEIKSPKINKQNARIKKFKVAGRHTLFTNSGKDFFIFNTIQLYFFLNETVFPSTSTTNVCVLALDSSLDSLKIVLQNKFIK